MRELIFYIHTCQPALTKPQLTILQNNDGPYYVIVSLKRAFFMRPVLRMHLKFQKPESVLKADISVFIFYFQDSIIFCLNFRFIEKST